MSTRDPMKEPRVREGNIRRAHKDREAARSFADRFLAVRPRPYLSLMQEVEDWRIGHGQPVHHPEWPIEPEEAGA